MKCRKSLGLGCIVEALERRQLLSAATSISLKLSASSALLGQDVTATATVTSPGGSPRGTVEIFDNGTLIGQGPINKHGIIAGTVGTLTNGTGGNVFSIGTNVFTAKYTGSASFGSSRTRRGTNLAIAMPTLTKVRHSGGVRVATIYAGSGAAAVSGNTVNLAYSEYLTTGTLADSTVEERNAGHGTGDVSFQINSVPLTVISGFNSGVVGMQTNEVRVIDIPAAEAYGNNPPPGIPDNAELFFVVGLISIS